jgi:hypothetical protein
VPSARLRVRVLPEMEPPFAFEPAGVASVVTAPLACATRGAHAVPFQI